ncbi:MAG TPA: energy transducer TonB [Thermoanaerobaculia bacterium]|nr:energy transducer TonB [Thermoanaerobaculia bacterium]
MRPLVFSLLLLATAAFADPTPYSVATLIHEKDDAALTAPLTAALQSSAPLVRATAARVVAVRGLKPLLPLLRERVGTEADATAAREEIRALALLGESDDVALATQSAARWPASMDQALGLAVARRGGRDAVDSYVSMLRKTRMKNVTEYFRIAMWGRPNLIGYAGSRLLAANDERGWRGLLDALEESQVGMDGGVLSASLTSESEELRAASIWYLVRAYAFDPSKISVVVRDKVLAERAELSSNREDFGVELLRRMLGGEKKNSPRWLSWLESDEADVLMRRVENSVLQHLTDEEYRVRYDRCEVQLRECVLPAKRSALTIPSRPVSPPAFNLPELLPAGLGDAVIAGAKCNDLWLGVGQATVDVAGRVQSLELDKVETNRACRSAIETLLRLSFATNTSLRSALTGEVILVHAARMPLCLDENEPRDDAPATLLRVGGDVEAPKVLKRVEPMFPESARKAMGRGRNVIIILECVISKDGCVRSIRILAQSPYPELNGAALLALSQWKFLPGRLDGQPVDVIFNLTVNFKM